MLGRGRFRFLPLPLRRLIGSARQGLKRRVTPDLHAFRDPKNFSGRHVAVAGLFRTTTGLGRAAELVSLTLERRGHQVSRVDLSEALGVPSTLQRGDCIDPGACTSLNISDIVLVINPDRPAIDVFARKWLLERCIIGHWIWEVEVLPQYWQSAAASYDEIWAPTELVADVVRTRIPDLRAPIKVVPYAIDLDPMPIIVERHRDQVRERLGLSRGDFVAGYSFAVDSNYYRKNPEDAVRAFIQAFPKHEDAAVRLFLRCNDFANRPLERSRLRNLVGEDARITIFDANDHIDIIDFYSALDVYLSTSRAEGYGLNLVEASQAGLPVISCGWRLPPEVHDLPWVRTVGFELVPLEDPQRQYAGLKGAVWSAPDIAEIAAILRQDRDAFRLARAVAGHS